MSVLDDVRDARCDCNADEDNHYDGCILNLKPRLVAALEAAERLVAAPMVMIDVHLTELEKALKS